jgi:hypothetical protein
MGSDQRRRGAVRTIRRASSQMLAVRLGVIFAPASEYGAGLRGEVMRPLAPNLDGDRARAADHQENKCRATKRTDYVSSQQGIEICGNPVTENQHGCTVVG